MRKFQERLLITVLMSIFIITCFLFPKISFAWSFTSSGCSAAMGSCMSWCGSGYEWIGTCGVTEACCKNRANTSGENPTQGMTEQEINNLPGLQGNTGTTGNNSSLAPSSSTAVGGPYTNQEKIPGAQPTSDFIQYMKDIINFLLATAGIMALFMLIIGAYMYLIGAASGNVAQAKETITSALLGLLLAMCAWIILYKINPDLVNLKGITQISGVSISNQAAVSGATGTYVAAKSCNNDELKNMAKQYASGAATACRLMAFAAAESTCNTLTGYTQACPPGKTCTAAGLFQITNATAQDCGVNNSSQLIRNTSLSFQVAACVINNKYKNCGNSQNVDACGQQNYRGQAPEASWLAKWNGTYNECTSSWGMAMSNPAIKYASLHILSAND